VRKLAVLSFHTSPLVQPGVGDSGGMNVYVRELVAALAQAGVACDVYTRRWDAELPSEVRIEPGFRVVHVPAGPPTDVAKEDLPDLVDDFAAGVLQHLRGGESADAIHANYWLSGVAGHRLKHDLDLPLVSTFHTLARVKAEADEPEPDDRVDAETKVIACSDAILASCVEEAADLERHYDAPRERIEIVPPGVDHAFFSPGPRAGARAALGLGGESDANRPLLLFVGRIQPLKGLDVAVQTLACLDRADAHLLVVGGPSGRHGAAELGRAHDLAEELGVAGRVSFTDPKPHHLLSTYYRAADVVLVPSRSESFGLVALEAAACGAPTVAAAVGGLRTVVEHGRTGFLVEGRDPAVFSAYVEEILGNPALAREMRAAATVRSRRYTWSTAAARLRRLYADLTARTLVECR
jgi:D-inositol-3-phosphate glycosyltransferase